MCQYTNTMLILSPEHYAIYRDAGWERRRIEEARHVAMLHLRADVLQGAHGIGDLRRLERRARPRAIPACHTGDP
jgi:hypothetical protein